MNREGTTKRSTLVLSLKRAGVKTLPLVAHLFEVLFNLTLSLFSTRRHLSRDATFFARCDIFRSYAFFISFHLEII